MVGINLLREGLDIPECALIAILDADKEGYLRSKTALIQTIGRAARNTEGRVVLYADKITKSMKEALDETERRRKIQNEYNIAHGIIPKSISKPPVTTVLTKPAKTKIEMKDIKNQIAELEKQMQEAVENLLFEEAAKCRDEIARLKSAN